MYDTKNEWFSHESQHFKEFSCGVASHERYIDSTGFAEHMRTVHNIDTLEQNNSAALQTFERLRPRAGGQCDLCQRTTNNLKHHLGRHLERIALFALPRPNRSADHEHSGSHRSSVSIGNVHDSQERSESQELPESVSSKDLSGQESYHSEVIDQIRPPDASDEEDWQEVKPELSQQTLLLPNTEEVPTPQQIPEENRT